jgi:2-amino-4-hydroxy-6-hydroxymethyldihydropteridine diphosphokinase
MAGCLISFGANLGNPLETIRGASELLRSSLGTGQGDYHLSRFFRTPPVGGPSGQPPFVNAVAALHTSCTVWEVWQAIRQVEQELGRQRDRRWEARRIDLDILLYDDVRIWTPQLKIPHPRMCMRRFILVPALDVAPEWIDPVSQWSIGQMAQSLQAGPGNLLLLGEKPEDYEDWLPEIKQQTRADVLPLGQAKSNAPTRWLSLCSYAALNAHLLDMAHGQAATPSHVGSSLTKLVMILAPASQQGPAAEADSCNWETRNLELAASWRLVANPPYTTQPSLTGHLLSDNPHIGPRYLLSASDREWATHEIVSALEAMDCPVEPLPG